MTKQEYRDTLPTIDNLIVGNTINTFIHKPAPLNKKWAIIVKVVSNTTESKFITVANENDMYDKLISLITKYTNISSIIYHSVNYFNSIRIIVHNKQNTVYIYTKYI